MNKRAFNDLPYIKFQEESDNSSGSWWLTCVKIDINDIDNK